MLRLDLCFGMILTIAGSLVSSPGSARAAASSFNRASERYSFSLTTFDPSGRLGQVERAQLAATMGPPVVFVALVGRDDGSPAGREEEESGRAPDQRESHRSVHLILAAPQVLPTSSSSPSSSAFLEDDGTPRFVRLTSELVAGHSGLSADGRWVLSRAQRLAVEHRYAYDEPIPVSVLLEELSLLYQQYTMKAAARPLGVSVLVAYLPTSAEEPWGLFRLDPSGNIESIRDGVVVMNGSLERTQLQSRLEDIVKDYQTAALNEKTKAELEREIADALRAALQEQAVKRGEIAAEQQPSDGARDRPTVIVAALSREVFTVRRCD
jgi:20S proteasome alpha/beta subunit